MIGERNVEVACPCGYRWKKRVHYGQTGIAVCTACTLYTRIQCYEDLALKLRTRRRAILQRREGRHPVKTHQ